MHMVALAKGVKLQNLHSPSQRTRASKSEAMELTQYTI